MILLIDSRHGLKPHDKDVMDALDKSAVAYQIVLTKADKVKPTEIAAAAARRGAIAKRPAAHPRDRHLVAKPAWGSSSCALKSRPWREAALPLRTAT